MHSTVLTTKREKKKRDRSVLFNCIFLYFLTIFLFASLFFKVLNISIHIINMHVYIYLQYIYKNDTSSILAKRFTVVFYYGNRVPSASIISNTFTHVLCI